MVITPLFMLDIEHPHLTNLMHDSTILKYGPLGTRAYIFAPKNASETSREGELCWLSEPTGLNLT